MPTSFIQSLESRMLLSSFSINDLGSLGGGWASASDINNSADIVGTSADENRVSRAFVWRLSEWGICQPSVMHMLDIPGSTESSAYAINDDGVIIGTATFSTDDGPVTRAYRYTNGTVEFLEPGDIQPVDINNLGQILTYRHSQTGDLPHVFLYDSSLKNPVHVADDSPVRINNAGIIAGERGPGGEQYSNPDFDHLRVKATALSETGHAWTHSLDPNVSSSTLHIREGQQSTDLTLTDPSLSFGFNVHMNNTGGIVGSVSLRDRFESTIWIRDGNVLRDINALLQSGLGFKIEALQGINDRGHMIASATIDGEMHAFIVSPNGDPFPIQVGPTDVRVQESAAIKSATSKSATRAARKKKLHHKRPSPAAHKPKAAPMNIKADLHPLLSRR
jgi:probable HAF family extracellular repeat protein